MRIYNLTGRQSKVYTSNVYLLLGDWSAIEDVNTLVDVGNDPEIVRQIQNAPTGVGKKAVEQVIFTHSHFDHTAFLPTIRELYNPVVYAYSAFAGADRQVRDGQFLNCGNATLEVIYTPGHSDDSICLFCEANGALFVGDTPVVIHSLDNTYEPRFIRALERLCTRQVKSIYFGHGEPILENGQAVLWESLKNVRTARDLRGR